MKFRALHIQNWQNVANIQIEIFICPLARNKLRFKRLEKQKNKKREIKFCLSTNRTNFAVAKK